MKRTLWFAVVLLAAGIALLWLRGTGDVQRDAEVSEILPRAPRPAPSPSPAPPKASAEATPMAPAPETPSPALQESPEERTSREPEPLPAERSLATELEQVQTTLRDYRAAFGENPVGTNAEITSALRGGNAKKIQFPVPVGSSVNANGELIDRWETPYFFHQLAAKQMDIHSAGPDRTFGTDDDQVQH